MKLAGLAAALGLAVAVAHPAMADQHTPLIAQGCAGCHGQSGEGAGAIASIAGYNREEFLQTWAEFRAGERQATIMTRIARGYTEAEVAELADYFSSLR
jgi:sulfide dehydrogenase cytochrome subunit